MSIYKLPDAALAGYHLAPPVTFFALPAGINNTIVGVHTGAGDYVWKTYETGFAPETIRAEHRVLHWLASQACSFAVPAPVLTRAGDSLCITPEGTKALFPLLPGSQPDRLDPQHIEAVGAALGELHMILSRYPEQPFARLPKYGQLDQIHPRIPDPGNLTPQQLGLPGTETEVELCAWWRDQIRELQGFLEETYELLPCQVVHGDFDPSNTLYRDGRITAILDFEMVSWDTRAIDVASGLKFSMCTWEQDDPWTMGRSFYRGYNRWISLTDAEVHSMRTLLLLRDVTATIWWLGRDRATGKQPVRLQRIHDLRLSATWLEAHSAQLENMLRISF